MIQYDTGHAEYVHVYLCVSFPFLNEEAITEYVIVISFFSFVQLSTDLEKLIFFGII